MESDPLIGTTIASEFELESILGTGTWSRVYKAKRVKDGSAVAIKLLRPELVANHEARVRFQREADAGQKLKHENICRTLEAGMHRDQPFIVMEYLQGTTLQFLLMRNKQIETNKAIDWIIQCCDGLQYAHSQEMLHRDVKPANIFICSDGNAKLLDFGLVKLLWDAEPGLTLPGTILGAIRYVSPEVAKALPLDSKSDIYSLACVLYELISGAPPFQADNAYDTIWMHVHDAPPKTGSKFDEVFDIALAKDPNARYQDALEFKAALAELRDST